MAHGAPRAVEAVERIGHRLDDRVPRGRRCIGCDAVDRRASVAEQGIDGWP
jgi:hypothetical protein